MPKVTDCCHKVLYNTSCALIIVSFILADIISCVEYNHDGELLATGDKGGRVVIFQRDQAVSACTLVSGSSGSLSYNNAKL